MTDGQDVSDLGEGGQNSPFFNPYHLGIEDWTKGVCGSYAVISNGNSSVLYFRVYQNIPVPQNGFIKTPPNKNTLLHLP